MDDINKIVEPLENSCLLIASETVKNEIKKQESGFLPMMAPMAMASSLIVYIVHS